MDRAKIISVFGAGIKKHQHFNDKENINREEKRKEKRWRKRHSK